MNTFEHLIGRQVLKILRVDLKEDYDYAAPIAIFFQLDKDAGLLIGQDYDHKTTTVGFKTSNEVRDYYGTDYYEACLNQLKPLDRLATFEGQTIRSVKVGEFKKDKLLGQGFTIKQGQYAGVVLEVGNQKLTIFNSNSGTELLFNSDLLFPKTDAWTLK